MRTSNFLTASDGTSIWYGTTGEGPPLVLCDGFACDGFIWPHVIDHFHDQFTIVRWHYRGHGRSETPEDLTRLSIQDLCDDLLAVLDALEIDQAILAGHSMGVQVILQSFGNFPERVRGLIPICGTFERPLDTFRDSDMLARMLPYMERASEFAPGLLQKIWETVLPSQMSFLLSHIAELNPRLVHGEDFRPYLEHTGRMDIRVYLGMLHHLAEHSAAHILEQIDVPTLILAAEHDSFTPLYRSEEMHQRVAGSDLVILPGGSHAGPIELPDTVNGAIEKFAMRNDLFTAPAPGHRVPTLPKTGTDDV